MVADKYYANRPTAKMLMFVGIALISAVKKNAVGYKLIEFPATSKEKERRFKSRRRYFSTSSMVRPCQYVFVKQLNKSAQILFSTDLSLSASQVCEIYGMRHSIEVSFRSMVHSLFSSGYRFFIHRKKDEKIQSRQSTRSY